MTDKDMDGLNDLERMTEFYLSSSMNSLSTESKLIYADKVLEISPDNHCVRVYLAELYLQDSVSKNAFMAYSHLLKALTDCGLEEKISSDSISEEEEEKLAKDKELIIEKIKGIYHTIIHKDKSPQLIEQSEKIVSLFNQKCEESIEKKDDSPIFCNFLMLQYKELFKGHFTLSTNIGDYHFFNKDYEKALELYPSSSKIVNPQMQIGIDDNFFEAIECKVAMCHYYLNDHDQLKSLLDKLDAFENDWGYSNFWKTLKKATKKGKRRKKK